MSPAQHRALERLAYAGDDGLPLDDANADGTVHRRTAEALARRDLAEIDDAGVAYITLEGLGFLERRHEPAR